MAQDIFSSSMHGRRGSMFVRQNLLEGGGKAKRHKHHFDLVSLLITGEVRAIVKGFEPRVLEVLAYIVIKKVHRRNFHSLSETAIRSCVFASRDVLLCEKTNRMAHFIRGNRSCR
ncbi:hypothetical protein NG726_02740 [Pseudomonas sp. MOB-449]|nr:hypothetical protein [Pseudomonas sp. MOB-449]